MDFWVMMAGSAMLAAAAVVDLYMWRMLQRKDRMIRDLRKVSENYLNDRETARSARDHYIRVCADKENENRRIATLHDRAERLLTERTRQLEEALKDRDAAFAAAEQSEHDAEMAVNARKEAELEAERCRKECAMHEQECRQLKGSIRKLHDEYKMLLEQETEAETLLRDELDNFLSYTGSAEGQKELKVPYAD